MFVVVVWVLVVLVVDLEQVAPGGVLVSMMEQFWSFGTPGSFNGFSGLFNGSGGGGVDIVSDL